VRGAEFVGTLIFKYNKYHEQSKKKISLLDSFSSWLNLDCYWNNSIFRDCVGNLGRRRIDNDICWHLQ